jgi:flagellar capping protein FliD
MFKEKLKDISVAVLAAQLRDVLKPDFESINQRLDRLDERVTRVEERMTDLEKRLDARMTDLEKRMDVRMTAIEKTLIGIQQNLEGEARAFHLMSLWRAEQAAAPASRPGT